MGQRRRGWLVGWLPVVCIDRARRGEQPGSLSLFLLLSFYLSFFLLLSLSHSLHTATPCERASIYLPTYTMFRPCATFSSLGDRSFFSLRANYLRPRRCPRHHVDRPLFLPIKQTPTANYRRPGEPIPTSSTPRNLMSLFFFLPLFLSFSLLFSLSLSFSAHLLVFVVKHLSNFGNRRKLVAYIDSNGRIF